MPRDLNSRIVYSTGRGKICPVCGWPLDDCRCSSRRGADEAVPARVTARMRLEKKGRAGKSVTVVYDLPRNAQFLKGLSQELKRTCGTGGSVVEDTIELQGDQRDRLRELLEHKGFIVKG